MDAYILQSEQTADEIAKAYYKASKQIEKEMAKVLNGLSAISDPQTAVRALKSNPAPKLITQLRKAVGAMPDGKEKQEALTLISSPAYPCQQCYSFFIIIYLLCHRRTYRYGSILH